MSRLRRKTKPAILTYNGTKDTEGDGGVKEKGILEQGAPKLETTNWDERYLVHNCKRCWKMVVEHK